MSFSVGEGNLIKAVVSAIPAYPMSCFMFPKTICDEIKATMGNLWWGSTDRGNKIHWKGWSSLCVPK